jgi:hypothetical protein
MKVDKTYLPLDIIGNYGNFQQFFFNSSLEIFFLIRDF